MVTVAEIMRSEPIHSVEPGAVLREAARRMHEAGVGSLLIIVGGRRLAGIISERDLVRAVSEGADPDRARVEEYMSSRPITARPEDSVVSAAHKMLAHGIRHLPVVDETGRVVGIISIRDVLRHILAEHEFP